MLPRTHSDEVSTFSSYEQALSALERGVPYRTTEAELKALASTSAATSAASREPMGGASRAWCLCATASCCSATMAGS